MSATRVIVLAALALGACGKAAQTAPAATAERAPRTPMEFARAGYIECETPRAATQTCDSTSRYVFNADGSIDEYGEEIVSPSEHINVQVHQRNLTERNGGFCGRVQDADLDHAGVTVSGAPAPDDVARRVRASLKQAAQGLTGEMCESFEPRSDGILARVAIDGVDRPDLARAVRFVRVSDHYSVRGL